MRLKFKVLVWRLKVKYRACSTGRGFGWTLAAISGRTMEGVAMATFTSLLWAGVYCKHTPKTHTDT